MRLYRCVSDYHPEKRGIALAIGNFDGFHVGHQAVIRTMQEKAQAMNLRSAVMIFEPQPLEFFGRNVPARLFNLRDKLRIFKASGIDVVFCMSFTRSFAALTDEQFVQKLHHDFQVESVTVGSLFSFGKGGKYTLIDLKRCCDELGIECSAISGVEMAGERISSTMIRKLIQEGEFSTAAKFIGRKYSISGRVAHGNKIGRTLGFPTANINLNRIVCPLSGVYAVRVNTKFGMFDGVANVGHRPTIAKALTQQSILEVNIFDFNYDIYGTQIDVTFEFKIRDEHRFASLDELVKQMSLDKQRAKILLSRSLD